MAPRPDCDAGLSSLELVLVAALVATLAGLAAPVTAQAIDAGRARHAAGFLASRVRLARQHAAFQARSVALVFDQTGSGWTFRICADGNGNGLRRADLTAGDDTCSEGPYAMEAMFPGVRVDVDPLLTGPAGEPGSADPVRLGSSNLASFSPEGTATSGTVFLRSPRGRQYAVRIAGVTGRTRILQYDTGTRTWQAA